MEDGFPCLWSNEVIQLYFFTIWSDVGVDLFKCFLHPCLWVAEVVRETQVVESCGVVRVIRLVLVLWMFRWYSHGACEKVV